MKIALIDAGPLIALFDANEPAHAHYESPLADAGAPYRLYSTWPCVVEASHLLGSVAWLEMLSTAIMTVDIKDFLRYRLPDGRAFEII